VKTRDGTNGKEIAPDARRIIPRNTQKLNVSLKMK